MALDNDKRDLAKVAQAEPAAFGRIRQKAMELGMSTEEFILSHDPQPSTQQKAAQPSQDQETIKQLINAMQIGFQQMGADLKALKQQQPAQQNQIDGLKGVIDAMKALRSYDNEVIAGHRAAVDAALAEVGDTEPFEQEDPFGSILSTLANKAISGGLNTNPLSPATPIPPSTTTYTMEKPKTIEEAVQKVPENVKGLIKSGVVDKATFLAHAKVDFPTASDTEINSVFDAIKG